MKLYLNFFLMHLKSHMQYKASFLMVMVGQFLSACTCFLGIYFMFTRFHAVEGFTYQQALLCFAAVGMAFALTEMFAQGFQMFDRMLGNGEFDRSLVRPRGAIFLTLASHMDFSRLGLMVQNAIVLAYAVSKSGVVWRWDKILTLCLMILCGSAVFFALFVVQAAFAFFTTESLEFMNILTYGGREFGRYPFAVYGRGILGFLTYVIPLALFQYYPLLYLLDRQSGVLYMLTPLLSVFFLLPAYGFFRLGLRRYKSTGS